MAPGEKEFQRPRLFLKKQADFQARPALKNVFPQPPDGNARVNMRMTETIRHQLERLFHTADLRVVQVLERGVKARTEQDGGFSQASISR